MTVSVGVSTLAPGAAPTAADLLHLADAALYRAKGSGRRVCGPLALATGAPAPPMIDWGGGPPVESQVADT